MPTMEEETKEWKLGFVVCPNMPGSSCILIYFGPNSNTNFILTTKRMPNLDVAETFM